MIISIALINHLTAHFLRLDVGNSYFRAQFHVVRIECDSFKTESIVLSHRLFLSNYRISE